MSRILKKLTNLGEKLFFLLRSIYHKNISLKYILVLGFNYLTYRNFNKLLWKFKSLPKYDEEDITIIIGVKNRFDYRVVNALRSIKNQRYSKNLIKTILVDYGSDNELISKLKKLCEEFDTEYVRVNNVPVWNRSHCLNIGIKKTSTKYVLVSDTDIIFKDNYISEAINELKKNPYQVVVSEMIDLTKEASKENINFETLNKARFKPRYFGTPHNSMPLTLTYFYYEINGFDEMYSVWGSEDNDLIKRFKYLGLNLKNICSKSVYFHQWHQKYEGVRTGDYKKQIEKNLKYFENTNTIKRNKNGWGLINSKSQTT